MNAIIEIGTNSLKLLIYRTEPDFEAVFDETIITRLSEDYNLYGVICSQALYRNIEEIQRCISVAQKYKCKNISLYGTMIFRNASNSKEVLQIILQRTGLKLNILSGQEEATYSFQAATHGIHVNNKKALVIDTGGGSTEFIFGEENSLRFAKSIDVGAVTLTDRFNLMNKVDAIVLKECKKYLLNEFNSLEIDFTPDIFIGIGGTVTTISAISQKLDSYSADKVQGSIINLKDIIKLENELSLKNLETRKNIIGLSPKRADIILGGVLIVRSIFDKYGASEMIVCDHGLRYGLALKEWRKK